MSKSWETQIVICEGCGHDTPRRSLGRPYLCFHCGRDYLRNPEVCWHQCVECDKWFVAPADQMVITECDECARTSAAVHFAGGRPDRAGYSDARYHGDWFHGQ
jgi:hypothetical protein